MAMAGLRTAQEGTGEEEHQAPDDNEHDEKVIGEAEFGLGAKDSSVEEKDGKLDEGVGHFLDDEDGFVELFGH